MGSGGVDKRCLLSAEKDVLGDIESEECLPTSHHHWQHCCSKC